MVHRPDCFDVIVVGGGPAGACTAGLLAQEGRRVLLLEAEKFPRFHIGESLITAVWPTLDRLGLRDQLDRLFVRKYGANVLWGGDAEFWGFLFREAGPFEYVHQVRRAEFDAVLLGRARELGAHVVEEAIVKDPLFEGERVAGVRYQIRGEDEVHEASASIVVDASGQKRWLGRALNLVEWHEDLKNIAIWSYYQGCKRYQGEQAGHTLIENLRDGWLWFIPLGQDTTSIGYVTPNSLFAASGMRIEELFESRLAQSAQVSGMMDRAARVSGYRTERDWSYTCRSFHGPGWVLVGDAAAFVDPLLSTGVALAVRGARILSDAVLMILDDPRLERAALAAYEANHRAFLNVILEFVRYFYDSTKTRAQYYSGAQQLIDPEQKEPPEFDFVKLVSGLARDEPLRLEPGAGDFGQRNFGEAISA
jgi:flavin-dependent dehydrogenase